MINSLKQREVNFKSRIKLNHQMYTPSRPSLSSRFEPSSAQQVLATVVPAEMFFVFPLNVIYMSMDYEVGGIPLDKTQWRTF